MIAKGTKIKFNSNYISWEFRNKIVLKLHSSFYETKPPRFNDGENVPGDNKFGKNPKCDRDRIKQELKKKLKKIWKKKNWKKKFQIKKGTKSPNKKGK